MDRFTSDRGGAPQDMDDKIIASRAMLRGIRPSQRQFSGSSGTTEWPCIQERRGDTARDTVM